MFRILTAIYAVCGMSTSDVGSVPSLYRTYFCFIDRKIPQLNPLSGGIFKPSTASRGEVIQVLA